MGASKLKTKSLRVFCRQVYFLTRANLKARYRKTFAGFLWVIINPLMIYGVQSQIFKKFLHISAPNYYLFLLSGLLPWIFITQSLEMGTPIIQNSGPLLKAFSAHPLVYLIAQLVDNFINFVAAFLVLLFFVSFFEAGPPLGLILLPIPLFFLALAVLGLSWILATLQIFLRDTRYIVSFFLSITFFATPIFYPAEFVPPDLRWIVTFNPAYILIAPFRSSLYIFDGPVFLISIAKEMVLTLAILVVALTLWNKKKNAIYFNV